MGVRSVPGPELRALVATIASRTQPARPDGAPAPKEAAPPRTAPEVPDVARQQADAPRPAPVQLSEGTGLNLKFDEATDRLVVQIVNDANEVIKQIPPEELLDVLARTRELQGLLFDQDV